ncbi:ropporin-1-like protein [Tubulanus polymorphus]|uniref:ropporin-1-like protein n=1 Tax=Tubulanus polymorphus TaxID=672921 RepID=UPI003DA3998D
MPAPDEPYYCSQQINIPPELPDILKQFTKAAIRTQPRDVLGWSAAYFKAMSRGEVPPVKERLEMPVATQKTDTGLTPGLLRALNKQLGPKKVTNISLIEEKWKELALPKEKFDDLVRLGSFAGDVEWLKFFALASSTLGENLCDAMKLICEILTADPEGGAARIPFTLWKDLYKFLASVDGEISQESIDEVCAHLQYDVDKQEGFVQPRNFLNPDCPKLSK